MGSPATAEALELYERGGYVIFGNVLDPDLLAEVDEHTAWLQPHHVPFGGCEAWV